MKTQRITDQQATALLHGRVPEGREDLQPLAAMVGALRLSSADAPPQPSAALAACLDLDRLSWLSASARTSASASGEKSVPPLVARPKLRKRTAFGWFAGLGIAAQIVIGAGAVTASAAGLGIAGALPPAAQQIFDDTLTAVAETGELLGWVPEDEEPGALPAESAELDAMASTDGADSREGVAAGDPEAVALDASDPMTEPTDLDRVLEIPDARGNGSDNANGKANGKADSDSGSAGGPGQSDPGNSKRGDDAGRDHGADPQPPGKGAGSDNAAAGGVDEAGASAGSTPGHAKETASDRPPSKGSPANGPAGDETGSGSTEPAKGLTDDSAFPAPGNGKGGSAEQGGHGRGGSGTAGRP